MEKRIDFSDWIEKIEKDETGVWITLYAENKELPNVDKGAIFCALVDDEYLNIAMSKSDWDLRINEVNPYAEIDENNTLEYSRFWDEGLEPLVFCRQFSGSVEGYLEISEEFRLLFNLFEKGTLENKEYIHIDKSGVQEPVVKISNFQLQINRKYLQEYLDIRKMNLLMFYSLQRYSGKSLKELQLQEINDEVKENLCIYFIGINSSDNTDFSTSSILMGKKVIQYNKNPRFNILNSPHKNFEEFIIGIDSDAKEQIHTCDERFLSNYFGRNPESPHYLTPVYFKKEVMNKYYNDTETYSILDGSITHKGLWMLPVDNNHPEYIVVALGDLGHLEYNEQKYWRSFNVLADSGLSNTTFKRWFEAEFTPPEEPILYFKSKFNSFQQKWSEKYGWYLFLPLREDDKHYFDALKIASEKNQKEFDHLILSVAKILIDSINEKEIAKGVHIEKENPRSIDKLEAYLNHNGLICRKMIDFFRKLYNLRSVYSAHRKTSKKKKIRNLINYFGLETKTFEEISIDIILYSIQTLDTLESKFL